MNELKIKELDYLQDSSIVYDFVHNKEWPIYLCGNNNIFSEHKYDIITASPKEKILFLMIGPPFRVKELKEYPMRSQFMFLKN